MFVKELHGIKNYKNALNFFNLLYNGYRVVPGGKEWPERDADTSPRSSAMVKKG